MWLVLLLVAVAVWLTLSGNGGFQQIDTSAAMTLLNQDKVASAKVNNVDQSIDLTLKKGETYTGGGVKNATKVEAFYINARGDEIVATLDKHPPSQGYTDTNPKGSWVSSLLYTLLPVILLGGLFFFLMNQMQGGGNRVMSFGKSRAKLVNKDTPKVTFADVAGADEAVEELQEIKEFLGRAGQVPGGRRQDPQGRAALRPAGHRQDPAGPRGRRRGRRALLLHLRLGLRRDVRRRRRLPGP